MIPAQIQAGREAVMLRNHYLESEVSFNQETTLCGKSIFKSIEKAKKSDFTVEVYYIGVDSVNICKERIRHCVAKGGHGIPDTDIERRYFKSLGSIKQV